MGLGAVGRRVDAVAEGLHKHGKGDAVGVLVDSRHDLFGLDEVVGRGGAARGGWRGAAGRAWWGDHVSEMLR